MLLYLLVVTLLASGADADVKCYHCSNTPSNVKCDQFNTCMGTSCYIAMANNSIFHAGCAPDVMLQSEGGACYTEGSRRICGCASELCNSAEGMGDITTAIFNPVPSIRLKNFFETITEIVPIAPVPPTEAPIPQRPTESTPAPVVERNATTTPGEGDSSEEKEASDGPMPLPDLNVTTSTPKPNGGSAMPFVIAAVLIAVVALF